MGTFPPSPARALSSTMRSLFTILLPWAVGAAAQILIMNFPKLKSTVQACNGEESHWIGAGIIFPETLYVTNAGCRITLHGIAPGFPNPTAFDGDNQVQMLEFGDGVEVTLININLRNANHPNYWDGGGAVIAKLGSKATYIDCVFKNNKAYRGGAVWAETSVEQTFINTQFINNIARGKAANQLEPRDVASWGGSINYDCTMANKIGTPYYMEYRDLSLDNPADSHVYVTQPCNEANHEAPDFSAKTFISQDLNVACASAPVSCTCKASIDEWYTDTLKCEEQACTPTEGQYFYDSAVRFSDSCPSKSCALGEQMDTSLYGTCKDCAQKEYAGKFYVTTGVCTTSDCSSRAATDSFTTPAIRDTDDCPVKTCDYGMEPQSPDFTTCVNCARVSYADKYYQTKGDCTVVPCIKDATEIFTTYLVRSDDSCTKQTCAWGTKPSDLGLACEDCPTREYIDKYYTTEGACDTQMCARAATEKFTTGSTPAVRQEISECPSVETCAWGMKPSDDGSVCEDCPMKEQSDKYYTTQGACDTQMCTNAKPGERFNTPSVYQSSDACTPTPCVAPEVGYTFKAEDTSGTCITVKCPGTIGTYYTEGTQDCTAKKCTNQLGDNEAYAKGYTTSPTGCLAVCAKDYTRSAKDQTCVKDESDATKAADNTGLIVGLVVTALALIVAGGIVAYCCFFKRRGPRGRTPLGGKQSGMDLDNIPTIVDDNDY